MSSARKPSLAHIRSETLIHNNEKEALSLLLHSVRGMKFVKPWILSRALVAASSRDEQSHVINEVRDLSCGIWVSSDE
jgi:hypothetical protein